jgi:hypothetical protein
MDVQVSMRLGYPILGAFIVLGAPRMVMASSSTGVEAPTPSSTTPISTDRPGNANAATTVPRGRVQIETSASYALDRSSGEADSHQINFPTVLRFGFLPRFEGRLGHGVLGVEVLREQDRSAREISATDALAGMKLQLVRARAVQAWIPDIALSVDVSIPIGSGSFTSDVTVPDLRLAVAWGLPAGFGVLVNLGQDVPITDDGERFARFVYVGNFNYALPWFDRRWSFFVESFGRIALQNGQSHIVQIDAGTTFRIAADWQIDAFTQHGLTDAATDLQAAIGLGVRL